MSTLPALLPQALTGLAGASTLFLLASGLSVIFGVTRVVNFAHGSLFMLGAYIGCTILRHLPGAPLWFLAGVLLAALCTALIGILLELTLLRRIYDAPELLQLLATFGVVLIVQDAALAVWGPEDLTLPRAPWLRLGLDLAGTRFPLYDLVLIAIGPIVLVALWLLLARTTWGIRVVAATENREMVAALGIDQRPIFTSVFALGAGLAGLAGALSLPDGSANLQMDMAAITDAFVVVVVGGLGSLAGAYGAAVLIGVGRALGVVLLPQATLVLVFALMAAVLVLRPRGLAGGTQTEPHGAANAAALVRPAGTPLRLGALALLVAMALAPCVAGPFTLSILTEAAIAIPFAVSLHLLVGPGGMVSFGHAAWFGIGAYAAALAVRLLACPMPLALLAGLLAAAVAAIGFGLVVARVSGVYLAMLTLAFAQIVWAATMQWTSVTGGDNGLLGIWPPSWANPTIFYWIALALAAAATLLLRRALYAPFGFALRACRDAPMRAAALGIDAPRLRLVALTLAGAVAGLSGALFAFAKGSVFPSVAGIPRSVDGLVMVLLGGVQATHGPVIGAIAYTFLYDTLLRATDLWRLWLGLAIVTLVVAFPRGLAVLRLTPA